MKAKQPLTLGLDLTGADRSPADLAPAILRLRELYPHLGMRVYWPLHAAIPAELLEIATGVEHHDISLSRLSTLHRFLQRWRGASPEVQVSRSDLASGQISIQLVDQVITMDEEPCAALRQSPQSAVPLAMAALRRGEIDAVVSCGNTGALVAAAQLQLPRLPGAKRLALAARLPGLGQQSDWVLADCGATLEPTADQLLRFTEWGTSFAHTVLGKPTLRIGLLNIGREECKGTAVMREVHGRLLQGERLRPDAHQFVGNVEPIHILSGEVDLVIAPGVLGNLLLKTLGCLHPAKEQRQGVAQVLGVAHPVFKLHGSSSSPAIVGGVAEVIGLLTSERVSSSIEA